MDKLSRQIFRSFKAQGLSLNSQAMEALTSVLQKQEDIQQSLGDILEAIAKRIEKREGSTILLQRLHLTFENFNL